MRGVTEAEKPKKATAALPPPPVVATGAARKHVALPTIAPPKPTFEAVLGALEDASQALETDAAAAGGAQ